MKSRNALLWASALVALASLVSVRADAQDSSLTVEAITDLGTLGGTFSTAYDINDAGQVVGVSATAVGESHAFLWQADTGMIDLGVLPEGTFSAAYSINEQGLVAGQNIWHDNTSYLFVWEAGTGLRNLGRLGGLGDMPLAGNSLGEIAGQRAICEARVCPIHAFLLQPGSDFLDLGAFYSFFPSYARDINDSTQVVGGGEWYYDQPHAFLWEAATGMIDLGTLPGGTSSLAWGINEAGQVVGWSDAERTGRRAFLWEADSGMTDLNTLIGAYGEAEARDINDAGLVVGVSDWISYGAAWKHAALWRPGAATVDLGVLDGGVSEAHRINNRLQVVGQATRANGETHAVLWTLVSGTTANRAPVAVCGGPLFVGFEPGDEGLPVRFNADGSWDADGDTLTFTWDFGDGGTGEGVWPEHTYADDGLHAAELTVADDEGASSTAVCRVEIGNVPPVVREPWEPTVILGETFIASGSFWDPGADSWTATVDYGDGSGVQALPLSGTSFTLSHDYVAEGAYPLTIIVTDDDGGFEPFETTAFVVTPRQAVQALSSVVDYLVKSGSLAAGNANALQAKLEAAIQQLDKGHADAVVGQLEAFIHQVQDLVVWGRLSPDQGQALIDEAAHIMRAIAW